MDFCSLCHSRMAIGDGCTASCCVTTGLFLGRHVFAFFGCRLHATFHATCSRQGRRWKWNGSPGSSSPIGSQAPEAETIHVATSRHCLQLIKREFAYRNSSTWTPYLAAHPWDAKYEALENRILLPARGNLFVESASTHMVA